MQFIGSNDLFHFPSFILFKYRVESTQNSLKVHVANDGAKIERLHNKNQVTVLNGLKYFLIANESYFKTKKFPSVDTYSENRCRVYHLY